MKKVANLGDNSTAMNNIGYMYHYGEGIQQNSNQAIYWYKKAIDLGNTTSMCNLGQLYEEIIKNPEEAKKWYKKAADAGDKNGKELLKRTEGCFITTAVCNSFNKPDNCYELTMFRDFRDNWLLKQADGRELIEEYYVIAPKIVEKINSLVNAKEIYKSIWDNYLKDCLYYLEQKNTKSCKKNYIDMVNNLKNKYL